MHFQIDISCRIKKGSKQASHDQVLHGILKEHFSQEELWDGNDAITGSRAR